MQTLCVTNELNSLAVRYRRSSDEETKRRLIDMLKLIVFDVGSLDENKDNVSVQRAKEQFYNIWSSFTYKQSGQYSLIQMNSLITSIEYETPSTCGKQCAFCNPQITHSTNVNLSLQYLLCDTFTQIVNTCIENLSLNIMDSSVTRVITQMLENITEFLTDKQKEECNVAINSILNILEENGWEGNGFSTAPDKKRIGLSKLIKVY